MLQRPLPPDGFEARFRRMADELLPDSLFAELYSPNGRPPISPSALTRILLLQLRNGRSDRQALEDLHYDVRWQYMCDLDIDECGFHPTVLTYFRMRLLFGTIDRKRIGWLQNQPGDLASRSPAMQVVKHMLDFAVEVGILNPEDVQGIDSTAILGAAQAQDCFHLVFQGIRQTLRAHAQAAPERHEALLAQLCRGEYLSAKHTKPVIEWTNKGAREALLVEYVLDAAKLKAACEGIDDEVLQASLKELLGLIDQDLLIAATGEVSIRKEVAPNRQCSTVDKQMRHARKSRSKRFNGYKLHVMVEPKSQLVTAATLTAGSLHDGQAAPALLEQSTPPLVIGDNAYAGLEMRQQALAMGTAIVTPTAPLQAPGVGAPTAEGDSAATEAAALAAETDAPVAAVGAAAPEADAATCADEGSAGGEDAAEGGETASAGAPSVPAVETFDRDHFALDEAAGTLTCPNGVVVNLRPSGKARFPITRCRECPFRAACTPGKRGREFDIRAGESLARNLRAYARTEQGRALVRQVRPATERIIGHLMRCGIRQGRYFGQPKTGLQTLLGVISHNLDKIGRRRVSGEAGGVPGNPERPSNAPSGCLVAALPRLRCIWVLLRRVGTLWASRGVWRLAPGGG